MIYFSPDFWAGFPEAIRQADLAGQVPLVIFLLGFCYAILVQVMGMGFLRRLALIPLSLLPFIAACCGGALHFAVAGTDFYGKFGRSNPTEEQIDHGAMVVRGAFRAAKTVMYLGALETIVLFCFTFLLLLGRHAGPRPVAR